MRHHLKKILSTLVLIYLISISSLASQSNPSPNAIDFKQYQIIHRAKIDFISDNLSGITYNKDTDSLFAVINNPEKIVELNKKGQLLRVITLVNFIDTEGIHFAITQERERNVTLVDIYDHTSILDAKNFKQFNLNNSSDSNSGLEGIAWSPKTGLFLANEHSPSEIVHLPHALMIGMPESAKHYGDILPKYYRELPVDDISGLHFAQDSQQLLVLSDESRRLLAINFSGEIQSQFDFNLGFFGLNREIEQPEGVTMDNNGQIYIVGEPNILLVMARK